MNLPQTLADLGGVPGSRALRFLQLQKWVHQLLGSFDEVGFAGSTDVTPDSDSEEQRVKERVRKALEEQLRRTDADGSASAALDANGKALNSTSVRAGSAPKRVGP